MDETLRRRAIALHDHFTHVSGDRRAFIAGLARLAGSVVAAEAIAATLAASPAAAAIVADDDPRIVAATLPTGGEGAPVAGYRAVPRGRGRYPAVMVVHENRGLQPYTRDVARRLAVAGFAAFAPDLLAPVGGTPAGDEDRARAMIAALDLGATLDRALATLRWLKAGHGRVGAVGFCWGGALVDRIAVAGGRLPDALVAFYGPAPAPTEAVRVEAPLLLHYAGLDTRVDATARPWVAALKAAGKPVTAWTYPNVDHAFHNDTAPGRYDRAAADLAWNRTIDFFRSHLA